MKSVDIFDTAFDIQISNEQVSCSLFQLIILEVFRQNYTRNECSQLFGGKFDAEINSAINFWSKHGIFVM